MQTVGFYSRRNEQPELTISDIPSIKAKIIRNLESGKYNKALRRCQTAINILGTDISKLQENISNVTTVTETEITTYRDIINARVTDLNEIRLLLDQVDQVDQAKEAMTSFSPSCVIS